MKKIFLLLTFFVLLSATAQKKALFLLAGQSNAVGQGDSTKSAVCKPNTAFEYLASTNSCVPLKDPVGLNWKLFQKAQTGSIAPAFAKRFNELSGKTVYFVTAARGGASCHVKAEMSNYGTWDVRGKNTLFEDAVEKVLLAEKNVGQTLSGILWMQGERDANAVLAGQLTALEYQEALKDLILRFRGRWGKKLPFYIVQTGYQLDKPRTGNDSIRMVQQRMASLLKNVYVVYAETGEFADRKWFKDNVHYNQEALNDVGKKAAESVFKTKLKKGRGGRKSL